MCYEDNVTKEALDDLFSRAKERDEVECILFSKDAEGNTPLQKASRHANFDCVDWIIRKWYEFGIDLSINAPDFMGYSALMHCCV